MEKKYTVELESEGCPHCGSGKTWIVLDPDGTQLSTSYGDEETAIHMAEELNHAYEMGQKSPRQDWAIKEPNE